MHGKEADACGVNASDDEVCAYMALVTEEMLLEHGHTCDNAGFAACGESVEFEVGGDDGGSKFGVGCCASPGTPYLGRDVM